MASSATLPQMPHCNAPPLRIRDKLLKDHLHVLAERVVAAARGKKQVERCCVVSALGRGGH